MREKNTSCDRRLPIRRFYFSDSSAIVMKETYYSLYDGFLGKTVL